MPAGSPLPDDGGGFAAAQSRRARDGPSPSRGRAPLRSARTKSSDMGPKRRNAGGFFCGGTHAPLPCPYLPTYQPYLWGTKKEIIGSVKVGYYTNCPFVFVCVAHLALP